MPRDQIFRESSDEISDFNFGEKTAAVFDDMLDRSIPHSSEGPRATSIRIQSIRITRTRQLVAHAR